MVIKSDAFLKLMSLISEITSFSQAYFCGGINATNLLDTNFKVDRSIKNLKNRVIECAFGTLLKYLRMIKSKILKC